MSRYPFKAIALVAVSAIALSLASTTADAAKKKKKRHYRDNAYSQSWYPNTTSGHNRCMQDQTRFPLADIRC